MLKLSIFSFLFLLSVANCQFFYNHEEDRSEEPQTYESSTYQHNPSAAANEQLANAHRNDGNPTNEVQRRITRVRVKSRNYNSQRNSNHPQDLSVHDQRGARQERRQVRRMQRQNGYAEVAPSPRIYSPSVFENIGLGEAPNGVYIPQDSFLNVLKRAEVPSPPSTNYFQRSSANYVHSKPQTRFFVSPPANDEPKQRNLILPVTRPQVQNAVSSVPQSTAASRSLSAHSRAVLTNRRSRAQPEYVAPPTVDIDSFREQTDDVDRENVMSQVEYFPVNSRQNTRTQSRQRASTSYLKPTFAPRVYSPSIFEKISLGESPSGVYVPDDSLLNALRNPSSANRSPVEYPQEPPQLTPHRAPHTISNDHEVELTEEEPYHPLPPPRRRSPQRARQNQSSRTLQRRQYQSQPQEPAIEPTIRKSQRKVGFENFERQRTSAIHRSRSQPSRTSSTAEAPAQRQQTQDLSPEREFRQAKLATAILPVDSDDDDIPGEAEVDYPILHKIPKTTFSCSQQDHNGFYADLETSCQVFHLCQAGGVQSSFLCSNGTIFNQEKFSCQWWYEVNCSDAPKFYAKNNELYKLPENKKRS